jgi:hypothetical protein
MVRGVYMEIEYPENGPIAVSSLFMGLHYPTIGAFYNSILRQVKKTPRSAFKGARQQEHPNVGGSPLFQINSREDAVCAITLIKDQGEGTGQDPFPADDPDDRAHYYRFAELYYGRKLVKRGGKWKYAGDKIDLPACYPVAEVPETGFGDVTKDFNAIYSDILNLLQAAWEMKSGAACFNKAISLMPTLGSSARRLMKKPLPEGSGVYGPDFKVIPRPVISC